MEPDGISYDTLKIADGIPIVNGRPLRGDWETVACNGEPICSFRTEITIPDDEYFMLGDNRPSSEDSRYWGPIPREWIIGQAMLIYWPPDRIGGL
jgi:signal peptidase I